VATSDLAPIDQLRSIVARLRAPDGCPWDREQTHQSLRAHLLEEAYEVIEAIERHDDAHFCEELGDFLLQVVLHSQIASEEGRFTLDDVALGIVEKLIRRHPHVFGEIKLGSSDAVLKQWEEIKRTEKGEPGRSAIDGVSEALPALMRALKAQKKAGRVGFDWAAAGDVLPKIAEEIGELQEAVASGDRARVEAEAGDLLFAVVNWLRKLDVEPELALNGATRRFAQRFREVERAVERGGRRLGDLALTELDAIWDDIKRQERARPAGSPAR
jgi:MazG family protein